MKILFVFGTRPEAIKLSPVIRCLRAVPGMQVLTCVTAQHRSMLDEAMELFGIAADYDLDVMRPGQSLPQLTARIVQGLEGVFEAAAPSLAVVQGDTTTTSCGALAAFYAGVPVAHVEAGLRTHTLREPFPEEMNRVLTTRLTDIHFAPTDRAAEHLRQEGVPGERILLTGNTGIDALFHIREQLRSGAIQAEPLAGLDASKRLVLVTAHRRESFGPPLEAICEAIRQITSLPDTQVVFPVHPNPRVRSVTDRMLAGVPGVLLTEPLGYARFVSLLDRACLVLTDSGGIQEEAPSLGKPVLVLRDVTERPEAVEAGTVRLVGPHTERIVLAAAELLGSPEEYSRMSRAHNPYGDGRASERIARYLQQNKTLSKGCH